MPITERLTQYWNNDEKDIATPSKAFSNERGENCAQIPIGHGNVWRILHSSIYLFGLDTLFHLALTTILE